MNGKCLRGDNCRYSHENSDIFGKSCGCGGIGYPIITEWTMWVADA